MITCHIYHKDDQMGSVLIIIPTKLNVINILTHLKYLSASWYPRQYWCMSYQLFLVKTQNIFYWLQPLYFARTFVICYNFFIIQGHILLAATSSFYKDTFRWLQLHYTSNVMVMWNYDIHILLTKGKSY